MSETAATPAVVVPMGFRLPTPGNWFDLDLDPGTRNQSIAAMVDARVAQSPAAVHNRQVLVRLLRRTAREAEQGGMVFASMMSEVAEGVPVSASATVTLRTATAPNGLGPISDPGDVAGYLRSDDEGIGGQQGEVRVVDIPAGRAVRLQGIQEGDVSGLASGVVTLVVQYFIPVPGTPSLAVLTFATPTLALAEPFIGLFDAMAENFSYEWDEQGAAGDPGEAAVEHAGGECRDEDAG